MKEAAKSQGHSKKPAAHKPTHKKEEKQLAHDSGEKIAPPSFENSQQGYKILCDAPGTYVFQK